MVVNLISSENNYLTALNVRETITGGSDKGQLLNTVNDPKFRNVGLREIQAPEGEGGQTWIVIHGWNSSPDAENIANLIDKIAQTADRSDRILALDWREAAYNGNPNNTAIATAQGGNGIAATWISATAEFVVKALEREYGVDSFSANQSLNLIGHSLGSLVSSEIGRIYESGENRAGERITNSNNQGVRTITALDPAAEINLKPDWIFGEESGYDVDSSVEGRQTPANFKDSSYFSRAYIGRRSIAGNPIFADAADEAYELDFGNTIDPILSKNTEHGRVVKTFTNLFDRPDKLGEILGYDSYLSSKASDTILESDSIFIRDFAEIDVTRRLRSRTYQGIINVDKTNQPTLLTANHLNSDRSKVIVGDYLPDTIYGSVDNDKLFGGNNDDRLFGQLGRDILVGGAGDDRLSGDGFNVGNDDLLYGGTGSDTLIGGDGYDTFVFQAGDGSSNRDRADLITDFEVGDRIGLIDISSNALTLESDAVGSTIKLNEEYLAVFEGVSLDEITTASQSTLFYRYVEPNEVDIV